MLSIGIFSCYNKGLSVDLLYNDTIVNGIIEKRGVFVRMYKNIKKQLHKKITMLHLK